MPTTPSTRELPNAIRPLAFAIVSGIGLSFAMSGTGNDFLDAIVVLTVLIGVVLSTRYTYRTYRRLSEHEFQLAHTPRWLMIVLALAINGFTCFLTVFPVILLIGMLLGGKGIA